MDKSIIEIYLPLGIFFNIALFTILMSIGWSVWGVPNKSLKQTSIVYIFLIVLVSVFSYEGDFYHYYDLFVTAQKGGLYATHLEDIYVALIDFTSVSYYIWRLIVWGLSILLMTQTCKLLKLNSLIVWFVYLSYGLIFFINGRVTLAMSIMFYGLALFIQSKGLFIRKLLGLAIIVCSMFFHKSVGFGIIIIIMSMIFNKINKYTIGISLLLIPLFVVACRMFIEEFLLMVGSGEIITTDAEAVNVITSGQGYITRDEEEIGSGRMLQKYMLWADFILWLILICSAITKHIYQSWSLSLRIFVNFTFFTLLISSLFFFDLGVNTRLLQVRFAEFAYFPAAITVTVCRMSRFNDKLTKWIVRVGIIQTMYNLMYALYIAIQNPKLS